MENHLFPDELMDFLEPIWVDLAAEFEDFFLVVTKSAGWNKAIEQNDKMIKFLNLKCFMQQILYFLGL